MIYQCRYCDKLRNEDEGIMVLEKVPGLIGQDAIYMFRSKDCMRKEGKEEFEKFKKKNN